MCKINCSGGCPECAPEEHAFDRWYSKYELHGGPYPNQKDFEDAFYAGRASVWDDVRAGLLAVPDDIVDGVQLA